MMTNWRWILQYCVEATATTKSYVNLLDVLDRQQHLLILIFQKQKSGIDQNKYRYRWEDDDEIQITGINRKECSVGFSSSNLLRTHNTFVRITIALSAIYKSFWMTGSNVKTKKCRSLSATIKEYHMLYLALLVVVGSIRQYKEKDYRYRTNRRCIN